MDIATLYVLRVIPQYHYNRPKEYEMSAWHIYIFKCRKLTRGSKMFNNNLVCSFVYFLVYSRPEALSVLRIFSDEFCVREVRLWKLLLQLSEATSLLSHIIQIYLQDAQFPYYFVFLWLPNMPDKVLKNLSRFSSCLTMLHSINSRKCFLISRAGRNLCSVDFFDKS